MKIGDRVRIQTPSVGPQAGVGRSGVVIAIHDRESSITGTHLRWTDVDVRLDTGAIVTRQPRELRVAE